MTVQELIDELQKVEDKTLPICTVNGTECHIDVDMWPKGIGLTHWIPLSHPEDPR